MPNHKHETQGYWSNAFQSGGNQCVSRTQINTDPVDTSAVCTSGGDAPHNNLMPYITCYMWKRTA